MAAYDLDQDGALNRTELQALLHALQLLRPRAEPTYPFDTSVVPVS